MIQNGVPPGIVVTPHGNVNPADVQKAMEAAAKAAAQQAKNKKPDGNKNNTPNKKDGNKDKEGEGIVKRQDDPGFKPDPVELKIKPDKDGKVQFSFRGQPWGDVLHWYASVSGMSLDWQELPSGYLNLITRRKYTLKETQDILNLHLLSRGFVMLSQGEVLSVVNLKKIDPSMVPRVKDPDTLFDLPPHSFVKVTFKLPQGLTAEAIKKDVESLKSKNGKAIALNTTNRLMVMDAVSNLREIHEMINAEQAFANSKVVPKTFRLVHARAADVVPTLYKLIGQGKSSPAMNPQMMQNMNSRQRQQMQQQMAMRAAQQQKNKGAVRGAKQVQINLVADKRHNVILANAPPEVLKIIEEALKVLDVPSGGAALLTNNAIKMQAYRLVSVDPQVISNTLMQIGGLDPQTQIQVDQRNRTLIAYASLADHVTIKSLIDKVDGSTRSLEVIPLYKLRAEEVAGTVKYLLGGDKDGKNQQDPFSMMYFGYSSYSSRRSNDDNDEFRIDADIASNRLLLWANEIEIKEVKDMLGKLGEVPSKAGDLRTVRVINGIGTEESIQLAKQLKEAWKGVSSAPLKIEIEKPVTKDLKKEQGSKADKPKESKETSEVKPETTTSIQSQHYFHLAQQTINDSKVDLPKENGKAPVKIEIRADGKIILKSPDPKALDQLEKLIVRLLPEPKEYEVFQIKYVRARLVWLNLEEFFEDELTKKKDDKNRNSGSFFLRAIEGLQGNDDKPRRLSYTKKKLRFIYDIDTNTIMVLNATSIQLKTIGDLIKIYDQKISEDSIPARQTKIFTLKYSKAPAIANAIKEVYSGLFNSQDLDNKNQKGSKDKEKSLSTYRFQSVVRIYDSSNINNKTPPQPIEARFDGVLSLGVDEVSNTIIVSSQVQVMPGIALMIESLDIAAKPKTTIQVRSLGPGLKAKALRKLLAKTLNEPWQGGKRPPYRGDGESNRMDGRNNPFGRGQSGTMTIGPDGKPLFVPSNNGKNASAPQVEAAEFSAP